MKRMSAILGLILLCGAAFAAAAGKSAHSTAGMTLTGCLQKGDEANTFLLTNATGPGAAAKVDRWELIGAPASLKMADHVGHKVEVTGHAVGAGAAAKMEGKKGAKAEKAEEAGEHHLKVRSFKHIAPTCP
ncbi:MAG TPA: hypothetical protein VGN09_25265 [Vicinamibacteria bacterium]